MFGFGIAVVGFEVKCLVFGFPIDVFGFEVDLKEQLDQTAS
jgi:hypothetical protein